MRYFEIIEQIAPVGTTTTPVTPGAATMIGNTAVLQDPKLQAAQAAQLAQQQKEKEEEKKQIQDQIKDLQQKLSDLSRTT